MPPPAPSPFGQPDPGSRGAVVGEVIAVTDQAVVQLAGEQGNAVNAGLVSEALAEVKRRPSVQIR